MSNQLPSLLAMDKKYLLRKNEKLCSISLRQTLVYGDAKNKVDSEI